MMAFEMPSNAVDQQYVRWRMWNEKRKSNAGTDSAKPTFSGLLDRLLYAERMVSQAESEVSERHIALEDAQIAVRSSVTGLFIGRKLLALDSAKDRLAQAERVLEARRADRASAREAVEKMAQAQQPVAPPNNIG